MARTQDPLRKALRIASESAREGGRVDVEGTDHQVSMYDSRNRFRVTHHYCLTDADGHTAVGGHTNIEEFINIAERWLKNHTTGVK